MYTLIVGDVNSKLFRDKRADIIMGKSYKFERTPFLGKLPLDLCKFDLKIFEKYDKIKFNLLNDYVNDKGFLSTSKPENVANEIFKELKILKVKLNKKIEFCAPVPTLCHETNDWILRFIFKFENYRKEIKLDSLPLRLYRLDANDLEKNYLETTNPLVFKNREYWDI